MSNGTGSGAPVAETIKIERDQWELFLAEFTRRNRGAHAWLDVLGEGVGYQLETEDRQFDGVAADVKDNERTVWISFASTTEDHIAHGIPEVIAIYWRDVAGRSGEALQIESQNGTKSILELSYPEEYALPPGKR